MKAVVQEEISGCGIATCAVLAGVSYAEARSRAKALGIHAQDQALWSDTAYVRRLATELGGELGARELPFESWEGLPDLAVLAIKWRRERGRPFWHWVVFRRDEGGERVLDSKKSLKRNVRRDFSRMKPRWFIEASVI